MINCLSSILRKLDVLKYKLPNNKNRKWGLYLINKIYITNNEQINNELTVLFII